MVNPIDMAFLAAALGDASRSRMVAALMDGRARTAGELAIDGEVSSSTASTHLARLCAAGILRVRKQGRHRYFCLSDGDTASAIESVMALTTRNPSKRLGPINPQLRHARICYDHLAGQAGVRLLHSLRACGYLSQSMEVVVTGAGENWFRVLGIDVPLLRNSRRALCRPCLDWSERIEHLAGAVGAALMEYMFARDFARRISDSRALTLTIRGERFIDDLRPLV